MAHKPWFDGFQRVGAAANFAMATPVLVQEGRRKMFKKAFQTGICTFALSTSLLLPCAVQAGSRPKSDQNSSQPTADQGKNNTSDRELMRQIRRDVVKDKTLSTYGHNVKIIAQGGKVTLKGAVHSEDEKQTIANYAQKYAGPGNVDDELTVKGDSK